MGLTQARLKELLNYDPDTGIFTRNITFYGKEKGQVAGHIRKDGYTRIAVDGKKYYAHRLAWLYIYGYFTENEIDHKDMNTSNNSISNLREASHLCNMRNKSTLSNNTTGVTGVYRIKTGKWRSQIVIGGSRKDLGTFIKFIDAVMARWAGEKKYNFHVCNTTSSAFVYLNNKGLL